MEKTKTELDGLELDREFIKGHVGACYWMKKRIKPAFIELYDIEQNKVVAIRDTNKEPGELLSCNIGSVEITSENYQNYRIIKVYQK